MTAVRPSPRPEASWSGLTPGMPKESPVIRAEVWKRAIQVAVLEPPSHFHCWPVPDVFNIHFPGYEGLTKPTVWVFPSLENLSKLRFCTIRRAPAGNRDARERNC